MDSLAHSAHAFIIYNIIYYICWNSIASPLYSVIAIFFGIFPDLDTIFYRLRGKDPDDNQFQHHLNYWTHFPLIYLPIVIIFIVSIIIKFYIELFLIPLVGIYSHLLSDSACCGDGMMWAKIPWKKDQFGVFYNLFSKKTDGYHGGYWSVRWRRTLMHKISIIEAILIIIFLILYQVQFDFSWGALICISLFVITFFIENHPIDSKYYEEPINGRYDDYRTNSRYLTWMKKKKLVFNDKMHVVKKS